LSAAVQQRRFFNESEERRPVDEHFKLCLGIPAIVLILEIDPKPGTLAPEIEEDLTRFRIIWRHLQDQKSSWKSNPSSDLGMFHFAVQAAIRDLHEPGYGAVETNVLRSEAKDRGTAHLSEHGNFSFQR